MSALTHLKSSSRTAILLSWGLARTAASCLSMALTGACCFLQKKFYHWRVARLRRKRAKLPLASRQLLDILETQHRGKILGN